MTMPNNMNQEIQQLRQEIQNLRREMQEQTHDGVKGQQIYFKNVWGSPIYSGSGAPTLSAPKGSLYLRTDGSSTSTRAYINTDGGTTWTNITTAA